MLSASSQATSGSPYFRLIIAAKRRWGGVHEEAPVVGGKPRVYKSYTEVTANA